MAEAGKTSAMTDTRHMDLDRVRAAERRAHWNAVRLAWLSLLAFWIIASLSIATEFDRMEIDHPPLVGWVTEGSSVLMTALFAPVMMALGVRFPVEPGRWQTSLPVHVAGYIAYVAIHVTGMVMLRKLAWVVAYDGTYTFIHTSAFQEILYEARKDLGTYIGYQVIIAVALALEHSRLETLMARAEARRSHRLTLKCGGRTLRIAAEEFLTAKAAGNYVEVRLAGGEHLARLTLADLQKQLSEAGVDAVRVHRSWLVNRDRVREITPTGEGDVAITLDTGETIPGSRRYRSELEAA